MAGTNQTDQIVKQDFAQINLLGHREENQDRVAVLNADEAMIIIAVDGMGGHANGAKAAELAIEIVTRAFTDIEKPVFDPQGFLHLAIGNAHTAIVQMGEDIAMEARPRATCALCLVQDASAYWAHVGDSRIYHLRGRRIKERSRDHSHVEVLLEEGLIKPEDIPSHPMRNFVECCLGGDAIVPSMGITCRKPLNSGDVLLVCTDGLWSGLSEDQIAGLVAADGDLTRNLKALGNMAVKASAPHSDNTSAVALRWAA